MSRKLYTNTLAALCTLALVFAVAMGVEAQSDDPLFEDDVVCSIRDGAELWVAPLALKAELEFQLGGTAKVKTLKNVLKGLLHAGETNSVRFEGGYPSAGVVVELQDLGYNTEIPVPAKLPSAASAVVRSA